MNKNYFYLALFSLLPVAYFIYQPIEMGDLAIWTALGRDSLAEHKIIRFDSYTITQTREMVYPWLLCFFYGWLNWLGGMKLVGLFHKLIPLFWAPIWYRSLRGKKFSWNLGILLVFYAALAGASLILIERPALVATLTFMASLLIILPSYKRQLQFKEMSFLIGIQILWVNIHGSFLIPPLLLLWSSLDNLLHRQTKDFLQKCFLSLALLLASLLNPFGWKIFPYVLETAKVSSARGIDEWAPPHTFAYPVSSWFFFLCSILVGIFFLRLIFQKKISWADFVLNPFFPIWMTGFMAIRNTGFFFLALPMVLGIHLNNKAAVAGQKTTGTSQWINAGIISALILMVILFNPFLKEGSANLLPSDKRPLYSEKSTLPLMNEYLNNHVGTVLNEWLYGSELAYFQKNKFYIDTRNIIFTDEVEKSYENFMYQQPGADLWLQQQNFTFILIDQKYHPQAAIYLSRNPDWKTVVQEGSVLLLQKNSRP